MFFKTFNISPKIILALCCTVAWTSATYGQLDKSEEYFQTLYGKPKHIEQESDGSKILFYIDDSYIITVRFIRGTSVLIAYEKIDGNKGTQEQVDLTDGDIKRFLEEYRDGQQWKPVKVPSSRYVTGASKMWKRCDEKLVANYQSETKLLYLATPDYLNKQEE